MSAPTPLYQPADAQQARNREPKYDAEDPPSALPSSQVPSRRSLPAWSPASTMSTATPDQRGADSKPLDEFDSKTRERLDRLMAAHPPRRGGRPRNPPSPSDTALRSWVVGLPCDTIHDSVLASISARRSLLIKLIAS